MGLDDREIWRAATFLVSSGNIAEREVVIGGDEGHHASDVLRVRVGDLVRVIDGGGAEALAAVSEVARGSIRVVIEERREHSRSGRLSLTVAQGLLKGRSFDEVVRRCSELGVASVVPLRTERSLGRIAQDALAQRLARWNGIAASAVKQSRGVFLPSMEPPLGISELAPLIREVDLALVAWEEERATSLKQALRGPEGGASISTAVLVVGPEGGLSENEIQVLTESGAIPVSAGRRVLKADWAAAAIAAAISNEVGGLLP